MTISGILLRFDTVDKNGTVFSLHSVSSFETKRVKVLHDDKAFVKELSQDLAVAVRGTEKIMVDADGNQIVIEMDVTSFDVCPKSFSIGNVKDE